MSIGLTLRSMPTPPELPLALSQHFAIPATFIARAQAGPVSLFHLGSNEHSV